MTLKATYQCSGCGRQLEEGEFMVVTGNTPPTGLSAPQGRVDAILEKVGKRHCQACLAKRYEHRRPGE
jgi:hypothetical protein